MSLHPSVGLGTVRQKADWQDGQAASQAHRESQHLLAEPVPGIKAKPDESSTPYFYVLIAGPQDFLFWAETFEVEQFLPEYPMEAPEAYFVAIN